MAEACHPAQVGLSPEVDKALQGLRSHVVNQVKVQQNLAVLQGCLEPLLAAHC